MLNNSELLALAPDLDRREKEILLAVAERRQREFILTHPEFIPNILASLRYKKYLRLRRAGYSIAVIIGHKEFYGLDFLVNKHTLVPRPETEMMVEEVVSEVKKLESGTLNLGLCLIDVGTGSGCIPITIAKHLNCHPERSEGSLAHQQYLDRDSSVVPPVAGLAQNDNFKIFATDISREALKIARKNAKKHGIEINFLHGNLLTPFINLPLPAGEGYGVREVGNNTDTSNRPHPPSLSRGERAIKRTFIITANLPYLTQAQFDSEPSIQHEPHSALVADNGGLALYEQLLQQITALVIPNANEGSLAQSVILLEIDPSQSSSITSLIKKYLPTASVEIKTDLAGQDRLVKISIVS